MLIVITMFITTKKTKTIRSPTEMNMITVKEAAKLLNVNAASVYNLINEKNNPLPAYRFGAIRINQEEMLEWMKTKRTVSA